MNLWIIYSISISGYCDILGVYEDEEMAKHDFMQIKENITGNEYYLESSKLIRGSK